MKFSPSSSSNAILFAIFIAKTLISYDRFFFAREKPTEIMKEKLVLALFTPEVSTAKCSISLTCPS